MKAAAVALLCLLAASCNAPGLPMAPSSIGAADAGGALPDAAPGDLAPAPADAVQVDVGHHAGGLGAPCATLVYCVGRCHPPLECAGVEPPQVEPGGEGGVACVAEDGGGGRCCRWWRSGARICEDCGAGEVCG